MTEDATSAKPSNDGEEAFAPPSRVAEGKTAADAATAKCDAELDGKPPDETDNANYFCEYAYMYHQMDMLEDTVRTGAYHSAIVSNPSCFEGKVVLDVGAGTCVLAMFAAMAGAKQVFAVEATDMAVRGKAIVAANGYTNIRVIQGTIETIDLPCKVDVIVSEWMGYALLRESMLDSVLFARDRWLNPDGALFPSHASLFVAPVAGVKALREKADAWKNERQHWSTFSENMSSWFSIDFSCAEQDFMQEQKKYSLQTGQFVNLVPKNLAGPGKPILELDLRTVTLDELKAPRTPQKCSLRITRDSAIEGFCAYFDVFFRGSPELKTEQDSTLSTAPSSGDTTHWGQQVFGFFPPFSARRGDSLDCTMLIKRQHPNPRLLKLETTWSHIRQGTVLDHRAETFYVD